MVAVRKTFLIRYGIFLLWGILFASHLFFIHSDADVNLSPGSRGPWTDEGLYTAQIRNFVNNGDLTFSESPCLIYTPLFSGMLFIPYELFGTTMFVSRITVLSLIFLGIVFISLKDAYFKKLLALASLLVLTQYHIYHYSHIALSEMLGVISILLGLFIFYRSRILRRNRKRNTILAAILFSVAYLFKIQYLYIVAAVPIYLSLSIIFSWIKRRRLDKEEIKDLLVHSVTLVLILLLYLILWYYPNRELYNFILTKMNETVDLGGSLHLSNKVKELFLSREVKWIAYGFGIALLFGVLFFSRKNTSKEFKILFPLLLIWAFLEMHKLSMSYIPTRYMVGAWFSLGMVFTLVLQEGLSQIPRRDKLVVSTTVLLVVIGVVIFTKNISFFIQSLHRRTYDIENIDKAIDSYSSLKGGIVMGSWAPALTWKSKVTTYPVWFDYFNDKDVIPTFKPSLIITELDQADSQEAFIKSGTNLKYFSDSITFSKVGMWELKMYWMTDKKQLEKKYKALSSRNKFLMDYELVDSANGYSLFLNPVTGRLIYEKESWISKDYVYSFFLRYTYRDKMGEQVSADIGFQWTEDEQIVIGSDAYLIQDLPRQEIESISTGQYYLDGSYKYPWVIYKRLADQLK